MSNARIVDGIWVRKVTWRKGHTWRTDMFKTVLSDHRLRFAEFHLEAGPRVRISQAELLRVLESGPDHYEGKIWGPFNIEPDASTVAGRKVEMEILAE
jgi:endonuclease/exonuclease/phosphatase family metal-dependent hydrolase